MLKMRSECNLPAKSSKPTLMSNVFTGIYVYKVDDIKHPKLTRTTICSKNILNSFKKSLENFREKKARFLKLWHHALKTVRTVNGLYYRL